MLEMHLNTSRGESWGEGVEFLGELSNDQFTTYEEISSLAGMVSGTLHNEGSGWLRFILDEKELIVAKKSIRYGVTWNHIQIANCVYGDKIIRVQGVEYKIRLLTGADEDPTEISASGYYLEGSHNSEWSRLFYSLVSDDPYLPNGKRNLSAPYSNLDLGIDSGYGSYSWCQETTLSSTNNRVSRGHTNVTRLLTIGYNGINSYRGWRPVLEALPPVLPPEPTSFYYYAPNLTFFGPTDARGYYLSELSEIGIG